MSKLEPDNALLVGLGLLSASTMLMELVLTRLFSANFGYHFAFMIVSMSMFGMTLGALATMLAPPMDKQTSALRLFLNASLFGVSIPASYALEVVASPYLIKAGPFIWLAFTFVLLALPFYFSGVGICLCLTRYGAVGKLYAADLLGAALACPLLVMGLSYLGAPKILVAAGSIAVLAAFIFAGGKFKLAIKYGGTVVCALLTGLWFLAPPGQAVYSDGKEAEYVAWTPMGRVAVADYTGPIKTWSRSAHIAPLYVRQKQLLIDFGAATVMTDGDASAEQLQPIKEDLTATANRLRPGSSLFVIGAGGGRDILTGLLYGQKRIDALEVNPAIVSLLNGRYAKFCGYLSKKPGVSIINDEARNWLARSANKYEVIQCSLVDTWAASSSGAFMLTENVLYTRQAFELFLRHLRPDGFFSVLRWGGQDTPGQPVRMLLLAKEALQANGISDPGKHILLIAAPGPPSVANLLVSPSPLSSADILAAKALCAQCKFDLLWAPGEACVQPFAGAMAASADDAGLPTDDRPFFFCPSRATDLISAMAEPAGGKGLTLLLFTLLQAAALVLLTILVPQWRRIGNQIGSFNSFWITAVFFGCLGTAFMFVEVGLIERLTIFLGNPTYGLSVVLFALLLACGAGSYIGQICLNRKLAALSLLRWALVLSAVLVLISALSSGWLSSVCEPAPLLVRMPVSILLVALPGLLMGCGFPLGMTLFTEQHPSAGAWYWAVNGSTSVLGSILAAIVSIQIGITATIVAGSITYAVALLAILAVKQPAPVKSYAGSSLPE